MNRQSFSPSIINKLNCLPFYLYCHVKQVRLNVLRCQADVFGTTIILSKRMAILKFAKWLVSLKNKKQKKKLVLFTRKIIGTDDILFLWPKCHNFFLLCYCRVSVHVCFHLYRNYKCILTEDLNTIWEGEGSAVPERNLTGVVYITAF